LDEGHVPAGRWVKKTHSSLLVLLLSLSLSISIKINQLFNSCGFSHPIGPSAMAAALAAAPPTPHNYRTVECRHFSLGKCNKGDSCTFKHTGGGGDANALSKRLGQTGEGEPLSQELRLS
jgi:hypothetical protein